MLRLWLRFESFLKKALVIGLLAIAAFYVINKIVPETDPLYSALVFIPGVIIVADFVIFGLLVLLSPLMWLFAIITGTIGVGVAVGNRLSDKR